MVMRKSPLNLDFRFNVSANLSRGGGEGGTPVAHDRPKFVNSHLVLDRKQEKSPNYGTLFLLAVSASIGLLGLKLCSL